VADFLVAVGLTGDDGLDAALFEKRSDRIAIVSSSASSRIMPP
jgi:hypothetical protein